MKDQNYIRFIKQFAHVIVSAVLREQVVAALQSEGIARHLGAVNDIGGRDHLVYRTRKYVAVNQLIACQCIDCTEK